MKVTFEGNTVEEIIRQYLNFVEAISGNKYYAVAPDPDGPEQEDVAKQQEHPAEEAETTQGSDDEATPETVLAALRAHVKKHGKDSALKILESFNVTRASELKKKDLAAAQEQLNG